MPPHCWSVSSLALPLKASAAVKTIGVLAPPFAINLEPLLTTRKSSPESETIWMPAGKVKVAALHPAFAVAWPPQSTPTSTWPWSP